MLGLWGQQTGQRCIAIRTGNTMKHYFFSTDEEASKFLMSYDGKRDAYFAPTIFKDANRTQASASVVGGFWLDLDCGEDKPYHTRQEALDALAVWLDKLKLPAPTIVDSGTSYHIYWVLDAHVGVDLWKPVAQQLKQACFAFGLNIDPSRTADSASLLRVPESVNQKNGGRVKLLHDGGRVTFDEFRAALPAMKLAVVSGGALKVKSEFDVQTEFAPSDLAKLVSKCEQMRTLVSKSLKGDKVEEPAWRAMLSVIKRCIDGDKLIHAVSKADPRYSYNETQDKADRTDAPATCETFACCDMTTCLRCPQRGKIKSPITLGVTHTTIVPTEQKDGDTFISQFERWTVAQKGVYREPNGEDNEAMPVQITACPVWVVACNEQTTTNNETGRASVTLHWTAIDGSNKRAVILQSVIYDSKAFVAWLANHNLVSQIFSVKEMVVYIKEATRELIKRKSVGKVYEQMGWYSEGFLVGSEIVTETGAKPASVQTTNPVRSINATGTVAAWVEGMSILGKPSLEQHAFTLLAGFGSPLLHLAGKSSAVLSLVGESGRGKTLSASAALSIYGEPRRLTQAAIATQNAIEQQLTMHRHIPHLLDEVSGMNVNRVADYLYTAANGKGKDSLNRNRESRSGGEWALVPIVTSNRPIAEMRHSDIQEAHRRRLLEVFMNTSISRADADIVVETIDRNYGAPRAVFLQAVCAIRKDIPNYFTRTEQEIMSLLPSIPAANRFGLWLLTAALLGGRIAKASGLITFDPLVPVLTVGRGLVEVSNSTLTDEERVLATINEFLSSHDGDICLWEEGACSTNVPRSPVARLDKKAGEVYIPRKVLKDLFLEEGISWHNIGGWLERNNITKCNRCISPSVPAKVVVYAFPTNLLGRE